MSTDQDTPSDSLDHTRRTQITNASIAIIADGKEPSFRCRSEAQQMIQALRMRADKLECDLELSEDEIEFTGHATVTVNVDVVGTIWAADEVAAEQAFGEALERYYYGTGTPVPTAPLNNVGSVEVESEEIDEVVVQWLDRQGAVEEEADHD